MIERSVRQLAAEVALVRTRDAVPHDAVIPVMDDRIPNLPHAQHDHVGAWIIPGIWKSATDDSPSQMPVYLAEDGRIVGLSGVAIVNGFSVAYAYAYTRIPFAAVPTDSLRLIRDGLTHMLSSS